MNKNNEWDTEIEAILDLFIASTKKTEHFFNKIIDKLSLISRFPDELSSLQKIKELIIDKDVFLDYDKSKTHIRKADLFYGIFNEFKDIYLCIVNGYYSTNYTSMLRNIANFFDAIYLMIENISKVVYENPARDEFRSVEDIFEFIFDNEYLHRFFVSENKLELHRGFYSGGLLKVYNGFELNIYKVVKNQAFNQEFFQKHLKRDYLPEEKEKLLEKFNLKSSDDWKFLFEPY